MFNKKIKDRKAQAGETITWVFATLVIIVILLISISIVNLMGNNKKFDSSKTADILASESLFSYLLTEEEQQTKESGEDKTIYETIKEKDDFTEFNGGLAVKIFKEFYKNDYSQVWLGFGDYGEILLETTISNKYFGARLKTTPVTEFSAVVERNSLSTIIHKEENSVIELLLA